jgi:hypothetical protein
MRNLKAAMVFQYCRLLEGFESVLAGYACREVSTEDSFKGYIVFPLNVLLGVSGQT